MGGINKAHKKMRLYQDGFHKVIETIFDPQELLVKIFTRQLEKAGYTLGENQLQHLKAQLIEYSDSDDKVIDIPGIDEDIEIDLLKELAEVEDQIMSSLPDLVNKSIDIAAEALLPSLKNNSSDMLRQHKKTRLSFEKKIASVWAEPLNLLETLLGIAVEAGDNISSILREEAAQNQDYVFEVVARLHARSCQISYEILTLLRAGYADGAHARWRSLHELVVVAFYIKDQGQEVAKRYLLHHITVRTKASRLYQDHFLALGMVPFDEEELKEFKQSEQEVIDELALDETEAKFYKKDYGWASTPGCLDPSFVDIARKAGFSHMSPYVKWASHNIHAGPTQFHTSLALTGIEDNVLATGPSTQGLTIPGQSTAVSIMQLTTLFLNFENTIDNIALCKVLSALSIEIEQSFLEAEKLVFD